MTEASKKRYAKSERGLASRAASERRRRQRAVLRCLRAYGGVKPVCFCCGENDIRFLTLDHVNNDGSKHRALLGCKPGSKMAFKLIKLNFPTDFPIQVACFNCNLGRERNGTVCPHKCPPADIPTGKTHRRKKPPYAQCIPA